DRTVTGVQTCALPIYRQSRIVTSFISRRPGSPIPATAKYKSGTATMKLVAFIRMHSEMTIAATRSGAHSRSRIQRRKKYSPIIRSEERRVGKEGGYQG